MTKLLMDEAYILRVEKRLSLSEISKALSISKSTASLWLRNHPLPKSELTARRSIGIKNLVESRALPVINKLDISPCKLGKAAELLFMSKCLQNGIDCYVPLSEDNRIDVIVGSKLRRVQVKTISPKGMYVKKVGHNSSKIRKEYTYTKDDIDFFVGVDLTHSDIYIIPIEDLINYKSVVSRRTIHRLVKADDFTKLV